MKHFRIAFIGFLLVFFFQPVLAGDGRLAPFDESTTATWREFRVVDGKKREFLIELIYDYKNHVAIEQISDTNGGLITRKQRPEIQLGPSQEEIDVAVQLVSDDAILSEKIKSDTHLNGGFILREGESSPCGSKSRCIQILCFGQDPVTPIFHAVVDLVTEKVIYRDYHRFPEGEKKK